MPGLASSELDVQLHWQGMLSDYVTAIAWSPTGDLIASSAAGEILLLPATGAMPEILLQSGQGRSLNCLAISPDGQFLAAGGQDGTVTLWQMSSWQLSSWQSSATPPHPITILENKSVWVDQMAWSPKANQLAFSLGRYGQVWDGDTGRIITTLNFEASSVLGMAWHPSGKYLALCGYQGGQVWNAEDWDEDPLRLEMSSASVAIAWSSDGRYIAQGNLDNTLAVMEWAMPEQPWVMQGFPGKVRQLAWAEANTATAAPLLATCSSETIVLWERHPNDEIGWTSQALAAHEGVVQAIAFQPNSCLLASAAADGWLCLWDQAQLTQVLEGVSNGFSCLSWHPQGHLLAAGGQNGELILWRTANTNSQ